MVIKVAIMENLEDAGIKILQSEGLCVISMESIADQLLKSEILREAEAIIVRSKTKVDKELLDKTPALKLIARAGIGVDNIDIKEATRRGIIVLFEPIGSITSVAELTLCLILTLARKINYIDGAMRKGLWLKKELGDELEGKTLGIVGLGRIGLLVAKKAKAIGMKVLAFDVDGKQLAKNGFPKIDLETVLGESDFITLHLSFAEKLVDKTFLELMKPGAKLINCSRGGVIDEPALLDALKSGELGGAALDVFTKEPPFSTAFFEEIKNLPNVILTPHIAGSTKESQERIAINIARQTAAYLKHRLIINAVNAPHIEAERFYKLGPYLELSRKLSSFISKLSLGEIRQVKIRYCGIKTDEEEVLDNVILRNVLAKFRPDIEYVNARVATKEMGVILESAISEEKIDYKNLLIIELIAGKNEYKIAGSLFMDGEPWIVAINDYKIKAGFSKYMLVIKNRDVPGVVGNVGTALGKAGININSLNLGANKETALMILNIDATPEKEIALREFLEATKYDPEFKDVVWAKLIIMG